MLVKVVLRWASFNKKKLEINKRKRHKTGPTDYFNIFFLYKIGSTLIKTT